MWFDRKTTSAVLLCAALSLTACAGTQPPANDRIDTALARAANEAQSEGEESLPLLEQLYKRNSSDSEAARKYARALRHKGYYNRADLVLKPFAEGEKVKDADVLTEYASIQAAMGNYIESEQYARKAVLAAPESGQAYHVLGIALDAQGHHDQARTAFEKGLDHWQGDPSPILNNMGLNLAAQGFLDEAIETLRKALDTAPNRTEIERNLRIVSALQYQPPSDGSRLVPKPPRKPEKTRQEKEIPGPDALPVEPVERDNTAAE